MMLDLPAGVKLVRRLASRRNCVWLANDRDRKLVVVKQYGDPGQADREQRQLLLLSDHGVAVPGVIERTGALLVMEYVAGDTLDRALEDDPLDTDDCVGRLTAWLVNLHHITDRGRVRLKGDANLSNFVCGAEGVIGLDFEEELWGCAVRDLGEIAAFILRHRPAFTEARYELAARFVHRYGEKAGTVACKEIRRETLRALQEGMYRRPEEQDMIAAALRLISSGGWL